MKKLVFIAILLLLLVLTACDPAGVLSPTDESTAPTGTTAPTETTPSDTTPSDTTPSDTAPVDTRPAEVAAMDEYFRSSRYNYYNALLELSFDDPRQVLLYVMFNGGFEGEHEPTDAEWAQLKSIPGFQEEMAFFRLPKDKMEAELKKCLGLSLEDMDDSAFEGLYYLESTDCYYFMTTGAAGLIDFYALRLENQSDGTIKMYYTHSTANGECVAVLKEVDGHYQILSNKQELLIPLSGLSYEQLKEMKEAGAVINELYGICEGYILFASHGQMGDIIHSVVADSTFLYPVEAYKDGTKISLREAYEQGIFSKTQIAAIAQAQNALHEEKYGTAE